MNLTAKIISCALFAALATTVAKGAQTPTPDPNATATPAATAEPATVQPQSTVVPQSTAAPKSTAPPQKKKFKLLRTATLPFTELAYAMTHQAAELKQLRSMKKVDYNNIRIVRLSSVLKARLHVGSGEQVLAYENPFAIQDAMMVAQSNGSNSPIANLANVLANINVSNALNNVLNNSNVGVNVSLADVLNNNKIAISQVLGVYVHGFSIINTIVK